MELNIQNIGPLTILNNITGNLDSSQFGPKSPFYKLFDALNPNTDTVKIPSGLNSASDMLCLSENTNQQNLKPETANCIIKEFLSRYGAPTDEAAETEGEVSVNVDPESLLSGLKKNFEALNKPDSDGIVKNRLKHSLSKSVMQNSIQHKGHQSEQTKMGISEFAHYSEGDDTEKIDALGELDSWYKNLTQTKNSTLSESDNEKALEFFLRFFQYHDNSEKPYADISNPVAINHAPDLNMPDADMPDWDIIDSELVAIMESGSAASTGKTKLDQIKEWLTQHGNTDVENDGQIISALVKEVHDYLNYNAFNPQVSIAHHDADVSGMTPVDTGSNEPYKAGLGGKRSDTDTKNNNTPKSMNAFPNLAQANSSLNNGAELVHERTTDTGPLAGQKVANSQTDGKANNEPEGTQSQKISSVNEPDKNTNNIDLKLKPVDGLGNGQKEAAKTLKASNEQKDFSEGQNNIAKSKDKNSHGDVVSPKTVHGIDRSHLNENKTPSDPTVQANADPNEMSPNLKPAVDQSGDIDALHSLGTGDKIKQSGGNTEHLAQKQSPIKQTIIMGPVPETQKSNMMTGSNSETGTEGDTADDGPLKTIPTELKPQTQGQAKENKEDLFEPKSNPVHNAEEKKGQHHSFSYVVAKEGNADKTDAGSEQKMQDLSNKMERLNASNISYKEENGNNELQQNRSEAITHAANVTKPESMQEVGQKVEAVDSHRTTDRVMQNAAQTTHLEKVESEKNVINQLVNKAVLELGKNKSELKIDIKPEHLGAIKINIVTENHQMTAKISAETVHAKEIILHHLDQLKADLHKGGLQIDSVDVSVDQDQNFERSGTKEGFAKQAKHLAQFRKNGLNGSPNEMKNPMNPYLKKETAIDYYA